MQNTKRSGYLGFIEGNNHTESQTYQSKRVKRNKINLTPRKLQLKAEIKGKNSKHLWTIRQWHSTLNINEEVSKRFFVKGLPSSVQEHPSRDDGKCTDEVGWFQMVGRGAHRMAKGIMWAERHGCHFEIQLQVKIMVLAGILALYNEWNWKLYREVCMEWLQVDADLILQPLE